MARRQAGDGAGEPAPSRVSARRPRAPEDPYDAAIRLLSYRERSAAELRTRLRAKGYPSEDVERALARLREEGLQDDRRFAEVFAGGAAGRGLATSAIRGALRRRGVSAELSAGATAETPEAEEERARALAARRAAQLSSYPPAVRRRRLEGFLARRGFEPALTRRLAAEIAAGPENPGDGLP